MQTDTKYVRLIYNAVFLYIQAPFVDTFAIFGMIILYVAMMVVS